MKKKNFGIIVVITLLVFLLKGLNILQTSNHLGTPFGMLFLIGLSSFLTIFIQKTIDENNALGNKNYHNLDILKYICAILILILHLRPFLNFSNELDLACNNIITRICVPVFFLITGYFAACKEKDNPHYLKEYRKKIIPTYILWSAFYIPIVILSGIAYLPLIEEKISLSFFLLLFFLFLPLILFIALFYTGVYYHLWYFPAVLCSLWVLEKWKKRWNSKYLLLLSFVLLLFGATETYYGVFPFSIQKLLSFYYHIFFTTRNFLFFALFYVVLGFQIGKRKEPYVKNCFVKLIVSAFLLVFEAIFLHDTNRLNSNILLSCVPLTYYLFVSVLYLSKSKEKYFFPFRALSKYYYLLHPAVITLLFTFSIINTDTNPYLQILLTVLFTDLFSRYILKKKKEKDSLFNKFFAKI